MTGSSLGKYSGSAQYSSPEKGAAAGNDTALAGASAAQGAGGVCQGRENKPRAFPREQAGMFAVTPDLVSRGNNAKAKPLSSSHPLVSVLQWALPIF